MKRFLFILSALFLILTSTHYAVGQEAPSQQEPAQEATPSGDWLNGLTDTDKLPEQVRDANQIPDPMGGR